MKISRHAKLLEIIEKKEIETQEELAAELKAVGIHVTQATVSRDIKDLRIVKTLSDSGKYKYTVMRDQDNVINERLIKVFSQSVLSIDFTGNIIVLKTFSGAGNAACEAIDAMSLNNIVGTIAGDNTIFVLMRSADDVVETIEKFKKLIG